MNISTSEYSSGCESGWTMYLDQLSNSTDHPYSRGFYTNCEGKGTYVNEDEEDEDLSMVSDASSGPPHFHDYENSNYYGDTSSVSEDKMKNKQQKCKTKEPIRPKKQQNLCLDDTASSPIFNFSQGNVPPPDNHNSVEVYSAAHFEGESITKKHLSFFKSSTKGKSGSLLGRKRQ